MFGPLTPICASDMYILLCLMLDKGLINNI